MLARKELLTAIRQAFAFAPIRDLCRNHLDTLMNDSVMLGHKAATSKGGGGANLESLRQSGYQVGLAALLSLSLPVNQLPCTANHCHNHLQLPFSCFP